jgi:hypothetical protein
MMIHKIEKTIKCSPNKLQDSGFDIFMPNDRAHYLSDTQKSIVSIDGARFLGLGLKCCILKKGVRCGFYLYQRSSISKTKMRLANSVGIINAGYRGELIETVDTIGVYDSNDIYHIWAETLGGIQKFDCYFHHILLELLLVRMNWELQSVEVVVLGHLESNFKIYLY